MTTLFSIQESIARPARDAIDLVSIKSFLTSLWYQVIFWHRRPTLLFWTFGVTHREKGVSNARRRFFDSSDQLVLLVQLFCKIKNWHRIQVRRKFNKLVTYTCDFFVCVLLVFQYVYWYINIRLRDQISKSQHAKPLNTRKQGSEILFSNQKRDYLVDFKTLIEVL